MTREEFVAWCIPAIRRWWSRHPKGRPSVDRIRTGGHYEIGNIRILDVVLNSRRRDFNKNTRAPKGKAWCSGCRGYVAIGLFSSAYTRPPLFVSNYCNPCKCRRYAERKRKRDRTYQDICGF